MKNPGATGAETLDGFEDESTVGVDIITWQTPSFEETETGKRFVIAAVPNCEDPLTSIA